MVAHCLFEQSGTFKNEFRKFGIEAYDYDILNDYGQTDYQVDLFREIRGGYENKPSLFDKVDQEDIILAFFPCTRFEDQAVLLFKGEQYQMKKYSDLQKIENSMRYHEELSENYQCISMLVVICIQKGLRLVIENPRGSLHYLNRYWPLEPSVIDPDRRKNGDYAKKPTQYWFIGCEPQNRILFEQIEPVASRIIENITKTEFGRNRQVVRSEIHPKYANRFIRQFIL